jgi:hypothetical protein
MSRWCDRALNFLLGILAVWLLAIVGTVAAVLFGVYIASIAALLLLFLSLRWLLKKVR